MTRNNYPMAQAASQHKWSEEEDGYSKHPHPHIIDWDNQWLVVGWTWGQRHLTCNLPRWKLGITRTPMNHGGRRCPTAAMVSHSRRQGIQQSSNMLCDKSTSWNLYYLFNLHDESLMHHVYFNRPRRCHKERPIWRLRRTRYAAILKGCIWTMFFCRGRGWWSCNFSIGGQQKLMLLAMAGSWWEFGWVGSIFGPKRQPKIFVLSFG
jgi:hypothetical protein